jgi:hypothetical protein
MDKVILESRRFKLIESRRIKSGRFHGKPYYRLAVDIWWPPMGMSPDEFLEAVRDVVDPDKCRGNQQTKSWKYDSRKRAEQHYLLLVMMWI